MNITEHFTLEEFLKSSTAKANNIDNSPPEDVVDNIKHLVINLLEPLRTAMLIPFIINSGYRCPELNKLVGGSIKSAHLQGQAADINLGSPNLNKLLINQLRKSGLEFDQCIDEHNCKWVHLSLKKEGNRKQFLKI